MDYILTQKQMVDLYFSAWRTHDAELLKQLFADKASYVILPRKKVLYGFAEIAAYWDRNAKRQKDVELEWEVGNITAHNAFSDFTAHFYDVELKAHVQIQGAICFCFEEGKTVYLSEYYSKYIS